MRRPAEPSDRERPADDPTPTQAELLRLLADVNAALTREHGLRARLRSLPTRVRLSVAGLGCVLLIAGTAILLHPAPEFRFAPGVRAWIVVGGYGLLSAALGMQVLRPLQRGGPTFPWAWLGLLAPFLYAAWPQTLRVAVSEPAHDCLLLGVVVGAATIGLLRCLDRADSPAPPTIALAAAAAGCVANLSLMFHCAAAQPLHVIGGHASLGFVLYLAYRGLSARSRRRFRRERA